MIFLIVIILGAVAAVLYIAISPTATSPSSVKIAELARITYAAAIFAIMFALTLGLHETFVRLVK